jgi:acyl CoA:acetate/3-ketoacid CoA transferase
VVAVFNLSWFYSEKSKANARLNVVDFPGSGRAYIADNGPVKYHGIVVDCVVVARPENHWQTFIEPYNRSFSSEVMIPVRFIEPSQMVRERSLPEGLLLNARRAAS